MSYNGWANYKTWVVNLWLTNESDYLHCRATELWGEAVENADDNDDVTDLKVEVSLALADEIESDVTEGNPLDGATMYTDLLTSAMQEVDYREIADSLLADK